MVLGGVGRLWVIMIDYRAVFVSICLLTLEICDYNLNLNTIPTFSRNTVIYAKL